MVLLRTFESSSGSCARFFYGGCGEEEEEGGEGGKRRTRNLFYSKHECEKGKMNIKLKKLYAGGER